MGSVRRRQLMNSGEAAIMVDDYPEYIRLDIDATEDFTYQTGYVAADILSGYKLDDNDIVTWSIYSSYTISIPKGQHVLYLIPRAGNTSKNRSFYIGVSNAPATFTYVRVPYNISSKWYNDSYTDSCTIRCYTRTMRIDILDSNIVYSFLKIDTAPLSDAVINVAKGIKQKYIDAGYGDYAIVKKMTEVKFKY